MQNIKFPVGRKIDDEFFTYKLVCNAKKVVNIDNILYNYRMRKTSVMNENNSDRLIYDRIDCFVERYDYIRKKYPSLDKKYLTKLYDSLLYYKTQVNNTEKLEKYISKIQKPKINKIDKINEIMRYKKLLDDSYDQSNKIKYE